MLRVAWIGPIAAEDTGGVPGMGALMLRGLLERGVEVDLYHADRLEGVPAALRRPGLRVVARCSGWAWGRWYSRTWLTAFLTSSVARALTHMRLTVALRRRAAQYDCIFQLSQTELFLLGWRHERLPPIVVHPCTSAASELRWHRRESRYARESESALAHYLARLVLVARARAQRRDLAKATIVIGPSAMFLDELAADYRLHRGKLRVLRHPINLDRFAGRAADRQPLRLLFVSRLAARKGFEKIVALSHRLADVPVEIVLAGSAGMWSNYSGHIAALHPDTARYVGAVPAEQMPALYRDATAVLVPSQYEPGSLVACEAVAAGLPVIVSDRVGPSEVLPRSVCRTFPADDTDAFEREVRNLLRDVAGDGADMAAEARSAAARLFSPSVIAERLETILREAAKSGTTETGLP